MTTDLTPLVSSVSGQPVVSSLTVAEHFKKRHDNVMRSIEALKSDLPEDVAALNFEGSEYTDASGRKLPAYHLARDGFSLLAMGFTGKKALDWKIRYIQAFNAMEAGLRAKAQQLPAERKLLEDYGLPRRPFFTGKEVADILCLNPETIRKWLAQHPELPVHQQRRGANVLIARKDLLQWIVNSRLQSPKPLELPTGKCRLTTFDLLTNDAEGRHAFTRCKEDFLACCYKHYDVALQRLEIVENKTTHASVWSVARNQRKEALRNIYDSACLAAHGLEQGLRESADFALFMSRI
ncbi:MAG: Rha family transcriptional regulator [Holophaga sp.]|nr:Rha family transcriptional regulator [Holophaga sp.]